MTAVTEGRGRSLTGTGRLVRFMLRRDRFKLPAWVGGIGLMTIYLAALLPVAYPEEDLQGIMVLFSDPVGRMITGPAYGFDAPGYDRIIANGYGLYFLILSALMSIFLVVRHTRVEEQTGRAELVRANVVGRHAPLTAAMIVALITNALVSLLVAAIMLGYGFEANGSLLLAASIGAAGLAFAGVAAFTAQLGESSRAAAGIAGAVIGAAFIVRGGGDMAQVGGTTLSWFSPLGWAQQTAPFVLDRWWPLALAVGFALLMTLLGFALSTRRDVGAGMLAVKPGPAEAPGWLGSSLTLAFRLQRSSIMWWAASLAVAGAMFGAFADSLLQAAEDMPAALQEVFGGTEQFLAGYTSFMAVYMSFIVSVFAVLAVQGMRAEENKNRVAPVLATPVGRWAWMGSNLFVAAVAVVLLQLIAGAATGLGAALVTGDSSLVIELIAAQVAHSPAVLVVLGFAALLFGVVPKAVGLAWALAGYSMFIGTYGPLMVDIPDLAYDISPFEHIARVPLEPFAAAPVVVLGAIALGLALVGLAGFRRRGINVT